MPKLNCVDVSRWGGEVTLQEATDMVNNGIHRMLVGTGDPNGAGLWARQQASMARTVKMDTGAYIYLYFAGDPVQQVHDGYNTLAGISVDEWWLDAEDTQSPNLTVNDRLKFLNTCCIEVQKITGKFPGIYTGAWWWVPNMNNTPSFSHLPLWDSFYPPGASPTNVEIEPWENRKYGKWSSPLIYQFAGTTNLYGQSVDLNYDTRYLDLAITDEEFQALMGRFFPSYIEAYYAKGFTARNAVIDPGEVSDNGPVKPWMDDLVAGLADHKHEPGGVIKDHP